MIRTLAFVNYMSALVGFGWTLYYRLKDGLFHRFEAMFGLYDGFMHKS